MRLIAIQDTVDVFAPNGSVRQVSFGQTVGELKQNSNDDFLVLTSGEKVDIDAVAIDTTQTSDAPISTAVAKTEFEQNQPIPGTVAKINNEGTNKQKRFRKLIGIGLTGAGIYFFFNGKKAMGVTMFVFGLIMLKRNSN